MYGLQCKKMQQKKTPEHFINLILNLWGISWDNAHWDKVFDLQFSSRASSCIPVSITQTNSLWQQLWFFATLWFQMCPQFASFRGCIVTLLAFCPNFLYCAFHLRCSDSITRTNSLWHNFWPLCDIKCVLNLPASENAIASICLIFLDCAFYLRCRASPTR